MMTSRATIGAIAINTRPAATNQGFITCLPNERVPLWFLYQWLVHNVPVFERLASGATFKEISRGTFRKIDLLLPTADLVHQYQTIADPIGQTVLMLQHQLRNLRATRDLLLPRLMSGRLSLAEAEAAV